MIRRSLLHVSLMAGLVLLAPGTGNTDPVQGAVIGGAAGAAIGGGAGSVPHLPPWVVDRVGPRTTTA